VVKHFQRLLAHLIRELVLERFMILGAHGKDASLTASVANRNSLVLLLSAIGNGCAGIHAVKSRSRGSEGVIKNLFESESDLYDRNARTPTYP
jgi:hypothetical protein